MPHFAWGSNYAFWVGSVKHAVVLLTVAAAATAIVLVGRALSERRRVKAERVAGLVLSGVWLAGFLFDLANPRASASTTLPLHWCDVCGVLSILVMWRPEYRLPRVLLHFWAICLCSFAFALPAIGLGPAFIDFWIYFGTHTAIILTAAYDVGVRGFVPDKRDAATAWIAAAMWTLLLQPINFALSANYGFVGADDHNVRRAITALGEWPCRLVPMLAIAAGMMVTLMLLERGVVGVVAWLMRNRTPIPQTYRLPSAVQPMPLAEAA